MEDLLKTMVLMETPSTDKPSLDRFASWAKDLFAQLPAKAEIAAQEKAGNHVRIEWGNGPRQITIVGHFDTVWDVGELAKRPWKVENGRAYGPGAYDMKGGVVAIYWALKALTELGVKTDKKIVVILNSDEEVGSRTSRSLIESEAKKSEYAMILEPGVPPHGAMKTARKGGGGFDVIAHGKSSHAGSAPEKGISAILELAHQTVKLMGLTNFETGTTVNVGVVSGGTRPNVIAEEARARVDVRVATMAEGERIVKAMNSLTPVVKGATLTVSGGLNRPPMERTPAIVAAYQKAKGLAAELGFDLPEASTGGGSDGNFTAALGTPTLDGLGMMGDGAHSAVEWVELSFLPKKAALVARLIETL
jgi:glutamate carboxypeptidase